MFVQVVSVVGISHLRRLISSGLTSMEVNQMFFCYFKDARNSNDVQESVF